MIALAQQSNILDEVIHGEALAVLRTLPDNSVDAIVCDPPAGISFMGKEWDNYSGERHRTTNSALERVETHDKYHGKFPFSHGNGTPTKKERDAFISFLTVIMAEALRVLKPGGHAFVWALPRTSHWTGIALEDAGFEIRDVITHLFGSGFPKSHDISAAIDKMQGAEREVIGKYDSRSAYDKYERTSSGIYEKFITGDRTYGTLDITAPATPEASQWNGWGTALKPASEHWWLCRKPLSEKNIAANVLKWGTGAINIDATRVHSIERPLLVRDCKDEVIQNAYGAGLNGSHAVGTTTQGRFPSNLLLSHSVWCVPNGVKRVRSQSGGPIRVKDGLKPHNVYGERAYSEFEPYQDSEGMEQVEDWLCDESCPIRLLDEQSGMRKSGGRITHPYETPTIGATPFSRSKDFQMERSEGGASRYFQRFYPFIYQAKASRAERNSGCEGLPEVEHGDYNNGKGFTGRTQVDGEWANTDNPRKPTTNGHPTVKSLALMRYLVRMITPPGGIVLDCFAGSGSTLVAAIHEGMHFIGIEMNDSEQEPYISIARARIEQAFREVQA